MEKTQARKTAKQRLFDMTLTEKKLADKVICDKLVESGKLRGNVCVYNSLTEEVDTSRLVEKALLACENVFLPVVVGDVLQCVKIDKNTAFRRGQWGIYEPIGERIDAEKLQIDLCITPLVAFDKQLNRVGKGKGFYDRFFASCECFKLGLAYSCQEIDSIDADNFDKKLDIIVTEKEVIERN
ncbi:MAG: 5-formyltetrahydrofolate cyclo-ligase [Clostridia bacterium]